MKNYRIPNWKRLLIDLKASYTILHYGLEEQCSVEKPYRDNHVSELFGEQIPIELVAFRVRELRKRHSQKLSRLLCTYISQHSVFICIKLGPEQISRSLLAVFCQHGSNGSRWITSVSMNPAQEIPGVQGLLVDGHWIVRGIVTFHKRYKHWGNEFDSSIVSRLTKHSINRSLTYRSEEERSWVYN